MCVKFAYFFIVAKDKKTYFTFPLCAPSISHARTHEVFFFKKKTSTRMPESKDEAKRKFMNDVKFNWTLSPNPRLTLIEFVFKDMECNFGL